MPGDQAPGNPKKKEGRGRKPKKDDTAPDSPTEGDAGSSTAASQKRRGKNRASAGQRTTASQNKGGRKPKKADTAPNSPEEQGAENVTAPNSPEEQGDNAGPSTTAPKQSKRRNPKKKEGIPCVFTVRKQGDAIDKNSYVEVVSKLIQRKWDEVLLARDDLTAATGTTDLQNVYLGVFKPEGFDVRMTYKNGLLTLVGGKTDKNSSWLYADWVFQTSTADDYEETDKWTYVEKYFQKLVKDDILDCLRGLDKKGWYLKGGTALALHGVKAAEDSADVDLQILEAENSETVLNMLNDALRLRIHCALRAKNVNGHYEINGSTAKLLQNVENTYKITLPKSKTGKLSLIRGDYFMGSLMDPRWPNMASAMKMTADCSIHAWKCAKEPSVKFKDGSFLLRKYPVSRYDSYVETDTKAMNLMQLKLTILMDDRVKTITLVDIVSPPEGGYMGMGSEPNLGGRLVQGLPVPDKHYLYEQLKLVLDAGSGAEEQKKERAYTRAFELVQKIYKDGDLDNQLTGLILPYLGLGGARKTAKAKKTATKKPVAKKTATKKPVAKATVAKKTATKKPVAKATVSKKPVAKKTATKKPATKKA